MKSMCAVMCLSFLILSVSCSEDIEKSSNENLYMEFVLDGTSYIVSNKEYQIAQGEASLKCNYMNDYVVGKHALALWDPKYENYIQGVSFALSKKVFKDDLDLSDESSYMKHVLNSESYGFPTNQNGYFSLYDLENGIFEVPKDVSAEGYLSLVINEDEEYHSITIVPSERDQSSYLIIDKKHDSKRSNNDFYDYIIEGRFRVNLMKIYDTTDTKIVEGNFRWPVKRIQNSEMLVLCD